jgi:hypothetical protein
LFPNAGGISAQNIFEPKVLEPALNLRKLAFNRQLSSSKDSQTENNPKNG